MPALPLVKLLLHSALITVISLIFGYRFFPSVALMAATGLLSLGLATPVARFLDENRDTIWNKEQTPLQANLLLSSRFTILFLASILVSFFYHLYFQSESLEQFEEIIASVYRNTFVEYLIHNVIVLSFPCIG